MRATTTETPAGVYCYTLQTICDLAPALARLRNDDMGALAAHWEGWFHTVDASLDGDTIHISAHDICDGACLVQASIHSPTRGAVDSVLTRLGERTGWLL
ncbi:hypothetical protein [Propionibacterium australiense]|uniref:hypothetical protein n=1 Tax=Propionibacterium australiense TaxID=119981 RepID=UPI0011C3B535|nr:hypothetical protein [Propionibacterium australiense]